MDTNRSQHEDSDEDNNSSSHFLSNPLPPLFASLPRSSRYEDKGGNNGEEELVVKPQRKKIYIHRCPFSHHHGNTASECSDNRYQCSINLKNDVCSFNILSDEKTHVVCPPQSPCEKADSAKYLNIANKINNVDSLSFVRRDRRSMRAMRGKSADQKLIMISRGLGNGKGRGDSSDEGEIGGRWDRNERVNTGQPEDYWSTHDIDSLLPLASVLSSSPSSSNNQSQSSALETTYKLSQDQFPLMTSVSQPNHSPYYFTSTSSSCMCYNDSTDPFASPVPISYSGSPLSSTQYNKPATSGSSTGFLNRTIIDIAHIFYSLDTPSDSIQHPTVPSQSSHQAPLQISSGVSNTGEDATNCTFPHPVVRHQESITSVFRQRCKHFFLKTLCPGATETEVRPVVSAVECLEDRVYMCTANSKADYCYQLATKLCSIHSELQQISKVSQQGVNIMGGEEGC